MIKDIKAKWVAALHSGKYVQGTDRLRSVDNKFCCLGVLCDSYNDGKWVKGSFEYTFLQNGAVLPNEVREWSGLDLDFIEIDGVFKRLAGHNDSGCTFAQIADAIEEQL